MVHQAANGRVDARAATRLAGPAVAGLLALAAVIAIALAAALAPAPASAGNDLTDTWTFFFGPRPGSTQPEAVCGDVVIVQTGEDLLLSSDCWDGQELRGFFKPDTRFFSIFGSFEEGFLFAVGTVAKDKKSISGFHGPPHSMIAPFRATRGATPPTPLPSPVGGIAFDPDLRALALQAHEPSGSNTGVIVAIPAAAAAFVALAGAVWHARRRMAK